MRKPVRRVIAIHDLCGFGRAALMNIIPILSYKGIETCPVPPMVLSSHTGGFDKIAIQNLKGFMEKNLEQWKEIRFHADCIFTGYLGGIEEGEITKKFIKELKDNDTLVVVDPVFGDDNELYPNMDIRMVDLMKELIEYSDIITPNYTEANFLVNKKPIQNPTKEDIKDLVEKLKELNIKKCIVTSVPSEDKLMTIYFDKNNQNYEYVINEKCQTSFIGTGDIFASALVANLLNDNSFSESVDKAVRFVVECIKYSSKFDYDRREGILLENCLHLL